MERRAVEIGSEIKDVVKARYGERARQASGCGTGEVCCGAKDLYPTVQIQGLPGGVLAASAGCGNPTALAGLLEGEIVLDLGSGGGIDCFLASRAVGKAGRVLGVDMTPEMVQLANKNARQLRASNAEFLLAELESLPLGDRTVDVIISNCVINLSPDKDAVFREAFRVLRPGGRLHVSDILLERALPETVMVDPEQWAGCIAGADLKEVYLERMRQAGFVKVVTRDELPVGQADQPDLAGAISAKLEAERPLR